MVFLVSKDEKDSLLAIMWSEAPEYIKRALDFEVLSMRAWPISCCGSWSCWFLLQNLSRRLMWFFSRREVASSSLFFHAGMFRVEALPTIRTLDFPLSMVPFSFVLSWAGRLIMLLIFNSTFRSIKFRFWVLLLLSFTLQIFGPWDMEGLIMGRSDDPHMDNLVMFIS